MTKQDVIKTLEKENIKYKIEGSVVFIYLKDYTTEEIYSVKNTLLNDYNGSIGFRPYKALQGEDDEESKKE